MRRGDKAGIDYGLHGAKVETPNTFFEYNTIQITKGSKNACSSISILV